MVRIDICYHLIDRSRVSEHENAGDTECHDQRHGLHLVEHGNEKMDILGSDLDGSGQAVDCVEYGSKSVGISRLCGCHELGDDLCLLRLGHKHKHRVDVRTGHVKKCGDALVVQDLVSDNGVEHLHGRLVDLADKLIDGLGGVLGSLEAKTGEHVHGGSSLLLVDDLALGVLLENVVGEHLGIADSAGDAGCGCAILGADDTGDLYLHAVLCDEAVLIEGEAIAHIGPYVVDLVTALDGIGLVGLDEKVGGGEKLELQAKQILVGVGIHLGGLVVAAHQVSHLVLDVLGIKHTEHIEGHLADLVVGVDYQDDLVVLGGPLTCDDLVLLVEDILIVDHLGKYVHTHRHSSAHFHKLAHAREGTAHVGEEGLHAHLHSALGVVDLEVVVVCILNIADVVLQLICVLLEILLERLEVVLYGGGHSAHHSTERVVDVDHTGITVIFGAGYAGHSREHRRQILRVLLKGEGISREGVLLHLRDEGVDTRGKRKYQCDTDDTDTTGKAGHKGTALLGGEVTKRKGASGEEGHLRLLGGGLLRLLARALDLLDHLLRGGDGLLGGLDLCLALESLLLDTLKLDALLLGTLVLCDLLCGDGSGVLDDVTVEKADYSGGILLCELGVVSYHNDETLTCDLADKVHYLHAGNGIERTGGLVSQKDLGVVHKRTCNSNALALTA